MVHYPTLSHGSTHYFSFTVALLYTVVVALVLFARIYFYLRFISVALYTPYILGYGTPGLSGSKGGWTLYECVDCGNKYKHKGSLQRHIKYECRKQPSFKCPYCVYRAYQKHNLLLHERHLHKDLPEKVDFVSEWPAAQYSSMSVNTWKLTKITN